MDNNNNNNNRALKAIANIVAARYGTVTIWYVMVE